MAIYPVILCGGSGTRLWPLSRAMHPKQFLHLMGDGEPSLIGATLRRLSPAQGFEAPTVLCSNDHRWLVHDEVTKTGIMPAAILLEPAPRNTSPAICAGALLLAERDPEAVMVVMPSDHVIRDEHAFVQAIGIAAKVAAKGSLTLFGIPPSEPHTGYGYIRRGRPLPSFPDQAFAIETFTEKPDRERAKSFLATGRYFWNSGIFVMSVATYLSEMERLSAETVAQCRAAIETSERDLGFTRLGAAAFAQNAPISIDYALMEKTDRAAMVALDCGWSDVGTWSSLWEISTRDGKGNHVSGDAVLHETQDCFVHADRGLVAMIGVKDLVVVRTPDAVMVADKSRAQEVPRIVEWLKAQGRSEHIHHVRHHRPWGYFESLSTGPAFQVKLLHVNPGAQLSLQMHHHRSEHWVVVRGTARVTVDGEERLVCENESAYISATQWHRLANPGKVGLEIIEVQIGSYLGEDDIVRREDVYGREGE